MPTPIEGNSLLLSGDRFQIYWHQWYRLVTLSRDPVAISKKLVTCEVDRLYFGGDRLMYVCKTISGTEPYPSMVGAEFVLECHPSLLNESAIS